MAKKITGYIKLQVPAGAANPSPPIGPALGQRGLNIMEFCKAFNAKTQDQEKGMPIPVTITVFSDKSFTFEMKTAPASFFLKKAAKLTSGSKTPGIASAGSVTRAQVREIAQAKMKDLNANDIENAMLHDRGLGPLDGHHGEGLTAMATSKRFKKAVEGIDAAKSYTVEEAVKLVKARATAKFDETIELSLNLGVDPRHADQMVRGVVSLPSGTGRSLRVAVFAKGAKAEEAKKAGADLVGAEDLAEQVNKGVIDFDRCIATPDMMGVVGRLGKVLGPRNLMPNPKVGTVTMDVTQAIKDAKGGAVEFRVEKAGIVQAGVGKASFAEDAIVANVKAFIDSVLKAKPSGAKGNYMKKISISSTMGPGVKISLGSVGAGGVT